MVKPAHYLVVEDEPAIQRMVSDALQSSGATVATASSVDAALKSASLSNPDAVVLDLGLVQSDGIDFINVFRSWSQRPILVLSARTSELEKIAALDAGADDFLSKPFSTGELLARLRSLLRRSEREREVAQVARFQFADVDVDLATHSVMRAGQRVHLTAQEYKLLTVFLTCAGKVLTHRNLLAQVWGPGHGSDSHYLRIYVGHLRQKLEPNPSLPKHFRTEIGVGYRFVLMED